MKAILVLDEMPAGCLRCHLAIDHCHGTIPPEKYYDKRPSWCPLKEMPKKMDEEDYRQKVNGNGDYYEQVIGWNACIEELEK